MDMTNIVHQLNEISSAVMYATEGLNLEDVLTRIAQVSRSLVQCKYAALGIPNESDGLQYFKVSGLSEHEIAMMDHLPLGHGLIRAPMRERMPIRIPSIKDDPRSAGFPPNHPEMITLLGVPIKIGDQLFGVLYLCDRIDGNLFTEEDQQLIETMAGYAALTIASATANEQQNRLKILEERERIGMELHDGIIQSLYAIGMQLDLLRMEDTTHADKFKPIIGSLDMVIGDIRRYIMQLRTTSETNLTIQQCMQDVVNKLSTPDSLTINIVAPDDRPPFAPATFRGICLIVNEALSNAIRHANATEILIEVSIKNNTFHITIQDNGQGFELEANNKGGLGLQNMHKRAHIYGGSITVDTAPGNGTQLKISVPIRNF